MTKVPGLRVLELRAENVKRVSVVHIKPGDNNTIVIAGENEQGKSSVLDALAFALGGGKLLPPKPLRDGTKHGSVYLDIGEFRITRTFTEGGGGSLTVTDATGNAKYKSPQAMLDALYNALTLDPLAFANATPAQQNAILRQIAGVDVTELNQRRSKLFDERSDANKEVKRLKGAIDTAPHHTEFDSMASEMSIDALSAELEAADKLTDAAREKAEAMRLAESRVEGLKLDALHANDKVLRLRRELKEAEEAAADIAAKIEPAEAAAKAANTAFTEATNAIPDRHDIMRRMKEADAHNQKMRENRAYGTLLNEYAAANEKAAGFTKQIEAIDEQKVQLLKDAKLPIEGLGITEDGVTFNDQPFEQASTAQRIRASVAIGLALSPKLRIMRIQNGNDLDATRLKMLDDIAREVGAQLWIERIAGGAEGMCTVVIEDGHVQGVEPTPAEPEGGDDEPTKKGGEPAPQTKTKKDLDLFGA